MYIHPHVKPEQARDLDTEVALCFALPEDGSVPEWVQLLPAGKIVNGIDGRTWINDNPQRVIDYFTAQQRAGRGLPFDWEHATELKAPKGDEAPASAWGAEMELREDGTLWAKPDWTARGRNSVAGREYRYLSPVLIYKKSTNQIVGIKSVGLTNYPNFTMTALNRGGAPLSTPGDDDTKKESAMNEAILKALGLGKDAGETDVLSAINTMKTDLTTANNRAENPDLSNFVPRSDHQLALNRAEKAEKALTDIRTEQLDKDIETAINQALKDKKISPSSVEYHTANCRAEGGLEKFKAYVESAPAIVGDSELDGKQVPEGTDTALNAAGELAGLFGNSAEDLKKHG